MSPYADFERPDCPKLSVLHAQMWQGVNVPPHGYGLATVGTCLGPTVPPGVVALVDPTAQPLPGDLVIVWMRAPEGFVQLLSPDRRTQLPAHESELDTDEDLREILKESPAWDVRRPRAVSAGKLLVRPLPPVEQWASDRDGGLVVEQLDPRLTVRTDLEQVMAVDKVTTLLAVQPDGRGNLRAWPVPIPHPGRPPTLTMHWAADQWVWGVEGAPT